MWKNPNIYSMVSTMADFIEVFNIVSLSPELCGNDWKAIKRKQNKKAILKEVE